MASDLRRAKKAFNIISIALIDQLLANFKNEPVLQFFRNEIYQFGKDPATAHVPAANYFGTMNLATKIKSESPEEEDAEVVVGELIIRCDERIFTTDCGVSIPALEALGLKTKWPKLSAIQKEMVWGYLGRLATHAVKVVVGMQMSNPKMQETLQRVLKSGEEIDPVQLTLAAKRAKKVLEATASFNDK